MKIRNGFVSNSSSSSFIVASKKLDDLEYTMKISLVDAVSYKIEDEADIGEYLNSHHNYNSIEEALADRHIAKKIAIIRKCLAEGKQVFVGIVSDYGDGGDATGDYIRRHGLEGNVSDKVDIIADVSETGNL